MAIINYDGISGINSITSVGSDVKFYNAAGSASFTITPSGSGGATLGDVTVSSINSGPVSGARNKFINGNFDIWQRGSSLTAQGANGLVYLADRWAIETWGSTTARVTYDRALDAPTVGGTVGFSSYSARVTVTTTSSNPTNDFGVFRQFIEGYNAQDLYQRPFTISFWVKSSLVGTYSLSSYGGGVGPGQTAGTPSFTQTYTINNANTWEYKIIQVPACPAGTYSNWDFGNGRGFDVMWRLWSNPGTYSGSFGTWNTTQYSIPGATTNFAGTNGATWQIAQVQLEAGTVATPFERRSYGQELALCQRYYEALSMTNLTYSSSATPNSTTNTVSFVVNKRAAPTMILFGDSTNTAGTVEAVPNGSNGSNISITSSATVRGFTVFKTGGTGVGYYTIYNTSSSGIPSSASAEL